MLTQKQQTSSTTDC